MSVSSPSVAAEQERLFAQILEQCRQADAAFDTASVRRAYAHAADVYGATMHRTQEPLLMHVLRVLQLLLPFRPDTDGVIACLLHHAPSTGRITLDELEKVYGAPVRAIVSGVHLLSRVSLENRRMAIENLRLMFLRVSDDIRVVLMILCDRVYILERLSSLTPEERKRVSRDALELFAPVAARLGIYSLKHQLEARGFPVAYPTDAARIADQMGVLHEQHGYFLEDVASSLVRFLQDNGVQARVQGREKQPYSIFRKMQNKNLTHVADLYDLFALRVIVDSEETCYQVLGLLHRIGHPVQNRFKDYIGFPKPNGYKSLHTTLARMPGVPDGVFVEVQMRTEEMHREADFGVAAHWSYKEGNEARLLQGAKLRQALGQGEESMNPDDQIFVLTPRGDILELPENATPLDFAFSVHTMLGLSFRAARVNGSIVPLTYSLENGDVVEILRHPHPHPSPRWLMHLKTASARARLKRFLATQDRPVLVARGRDLLNAELKRLRLPSLDPDLSIIRRMNGAELSLTEREDVLLKLGQGAQNAASLLPHLDALRDHLPPSVPSAPASVGLQDAPPALSAAAEIPMPIRYAKCCKPDQFPGVPITGVISREGDIRVHRVDCKLLKHVNPQRRIRVTWIRSAKRSRAKK